MTIRVGCIGTARRAGHHLDCLSKMENVEIKALCDIAEDKVQQAAQRYGGRVYSEYHQMLDQEELDAVYVITPPLVHTEQAVAAAERGHHIFLEKPITLTMAEARRIQKAVDEAGVLCSVGYQLRYSDTADVVRERLAGHPIAMVAGHYYWTVPLVKWVIDKSNTGGQIVEQATHLMDLCRYFVGDIQTVYARYTLKTRMEVEGYNNWDANCVTFEFENGTVGSMVSTYALFPGIPDNSGLDIVADELLVRYRANQVDVLTRDSTASLEATSDSTCGANEAFIQAIETGDRSLIRSVLADGIRSLAVTLAANQSAETGQPVSVDEFIRAAH